MRTEMNGDKISTVPLRYIMKLKMIQVLSQRDKYWLSLPNLDARLLTYPTGNILMFEIQSV